MTAPAHTGVPSAPTVLRAAAEPSADAVRTGSAAALTISFRGELADLPDLAAGMVLIDRWVEQLLAAGALDEATTDVFERLVDDWAGRFRQRLLQDSLDRQAHADDLQAEARAAAARALLDRRRAEREYAFALAALDAVRGHTPGGGAAAPAPYGGPPDGPETVDVPTASAPDAAAWPERGAA